MKHYLEKRNRKDEVKPSLPNEKILSNVNASKGFFCVKGGI